MRQRLIQKYSEFIFKFRIAIYAFAVILTTVCAVAALRLDLKTDFSALLPQQLPSVVALKEAQRRIGGTGLLLVGVESPDFEANKKFVEAMVPKLKPLVGKSIRYIEYKYNAERDYALKFGMHYLTLAQLEKLRARIEREISREKTSAIIGSELVEEEEEVKDKKPYYEEVEDLEEGYKAILKYRQSYLSADDGRIMVISIRPMGSSLGLEDSKALTDQVHKIIDELNPKSFDARLNVGLAGGVQSMLDEFETIKQDIVGTALLLAALILAALFLYFWSFRFVSLLMSILVFAIIWTFGYTRLHIGYLNTQTAFLSSLVVGTGINYGIIFLASYKELRMARVEPLNAINQAIHSTVIPTFIASVTTCMSFASLLLSNNKGLSEFGLIGGVGILFCWVVTYSLLPLFFVRIGTFYSLALQDPSISRTISRDFWMGGESGDQTPTPTRGSHAFDDLGGGLRVSEFGTGYVGTEFRQSSQPHVANVGNGRAGSPLKPSFSNKSHARHCPSRQ